MTTRIFRRAAIAGAIIFAPAIAQSRDSLSVNPSSPLSTDAITFSGKYDNPGWHFDGVTVSVSGQFVTVLYRQTGSVGTLPSEDPYSVAGGPLPSGEYVAQLFLQVRLSESEPYSEPAARTPQVAFTVRSAPYLRATVLEFKHASLNHYFITADPLEQQSLLDGAQPGWSPTGESLKALAPSPSDANLAGVCRFYGSVMPGPNSHFYTLLADECAALRNLEQSTPASIPRWNYEGLAFAAAPPYADKTCPLSFPSAIRRFYNGRAMHNDSNHRYVSNPAIAEEMRNREWIDEGVVMCVPSE